MNNEFKLQKLKGLIVGAGKTYEDCAKQLGISKTSFSNRMNGKVQFDIVEINILAKYLNLKIEDIIDIFLINLMTKIKFQKPDKEMEAYDKGR